MEEGGKKGGARKVTARGAQVRERGAGNPQLGRRLLAWRCVGGRHAEGARPAALGM